MHLCFRRRIHEGNIHPGELLLPRKGRPQGCQERIRDAQGTCRQGFHQVGFPCGGSILHRRCGPPGLQEGVLSVQGGCREGQRVLPILSRRMLRQGSRYFRGQGRGTEMVSQGRPAGTHRLAENRGGTQERGDSQRRIALRHLPQERPCGRCTVDVHPRKVL